MTKEALINYIKKYYNLENDENISFEDLQNNLNFYLTSYRELFQDKFECILIHKYYKDFLEEVMPVVNTVNTIYTNGSIVFNQDLYHMAGKASEINKKILDRIIYFAKMEGVALNDEFGKQLLEFEKIKDNNIFEINQGNSEIRAPHEIKQFDYSKEYWEVTKNYFISKENEINKQLLQNFEERDIEDAENLLNIIYEYNKCKTTSKQK